MARPELRWYHSSATRIHTCGSVAPENVTWLSLLKSFKLEAIGVRLEWRGWRFAMLEQSCYSLLHWDECIW